jgi:uncharacterized protein (TIGR00266 family)
MQYQILGTTMQTVEITLAQGETVFTERGGMSWYHGDFKMETAMAGGLMKALGRSLSGESMFLTTYQSASPGGKITFASKFPGSIQALKLGDGESMVCQKRAFLCAESSVQLSVHWRKKLAAGFFGGEGFVLQKVTGPGVAFVEISGELTQLELAPGQLLTVDTGHVAIQQPSVGFDIEMVHGVKNLLFGGEGLFLAKLRGPGKVWLQSMPIQNLASALLSYMPTK